MESPQIRLTCSASLSSAGPGAGPPPPPRPTCPMPHPSPAGLQSEMLAAQERRLRLRQTRPVIP